MEDDGSRGGGGIDTIESQILLLPCLLLAPLLRSASPVQLALDMLGILVTSNQGFTAAIMNSLVLWSGRNWRQV